KEPGPDITFRHAAHADIKEENGPATRKSTMGYVFLMADAAVSWSSAKQRRVATSPTEAESIAMVYAGKQAIWMWKFLDGVELREEFPFTVKVDNTSAISLTEATTKHARTKHFDYDSAWIRDEVREQELAFEYVPSSETLADLFTKALPRAQHEKFVKMLGLDVDL
ncbi:hypothetical protein MPER_10107, partial [Moniliophthora perniciosa FA553]